MNPAVGTAAMSRRDCPIVVGGCHRSGTTLVRRILDAHPRIHCGPEVTFFRDFHGDYFDDPLRHLRFATTARDLLPEPDLLEVLGRAFVELHERAARRAGKRRWADKAPENVLYAGHWQRLLGDRWLLVHVVRNPLDTIASMNEARFPLTFPPDLDGRVAFYRRYMEAGQAFGQEHPERYRRVAYEQLCESPETVARELMAWLGEDFDRRQLALDAATPPEAGLEDPKIAETAGVHGDSIGRWTEALTADQAALVRSRTADLWPRTDPDPRHDAPEARCE